MHKDRLFQFPINYVLIFKALLFLCIITALHTEPSQAREYLLDEGIEEIKNQIDKQVKVLKVKSLALLDFTDINGKDDMFGRYLSEKLIITLFNLEGITVVERNKLNQVLSEHERQQAGLIDPTTTKKIGQFLGIDALMVGTVTDMGDSLEVIGRLVHTETARILAVTLLSFTKDSKIDMIYRQSLGGAGVQSLSTRSVPAGFTDPFTSKMFVFVKGGCFDMGDTFGDGEKDERPVHGVCLKDFYIGKYEVTQSQWERIMGYNPSRFRKGPDYPVEEVSWENAHEFTERLQKLSGKSYRLPTEAEWEYAARSRGNKEKFSGTSKENELGDYAWYASNTKIGPMIVGTRLPNALGIYDMSGNVWEWCSDWYDDRYYQKRVKDNPSGGDVTELKVLRGGAWNYNATHLRAANRSRSKPTERHNNNNGLRLVLPVR